MPAIASRRQFLALLGVTALGAAGCAASEVIDRAFRPDPGKVGSLADIDHIVLLMQENRSFDHYFGTMSGVRGFDDPAGRFAQSGYAPGVGPTPNGVLWPFHLDTTQRRLNAEVLDDPTHAWSSQHAVWDGGRLDEWVRVHVRDDKVNGPLTMGYYTRRDLPTHYALADAFTVCDAYFSSVLGSTAPNRLHWMSGSIDPHGTAGGPIIGTLTDVRRGSLRWRTYPEQLSDAGVSWKIYNAEPPSATVDLNGMVDYFAAYRDPSTELHARGIAPRYPADFVADLHAGRLPSVSWIIPTRAYSEHPSQPAAVGADGIVDVLAALTARPDVWERTALIVSWDENGGLFDHVPPPTAPPGTAGEYGRHTGPLAAAMNPLGPIGLGFRVPCLVLSPYTRGGWVCSEVFDHTSQLRLLEARFGAPLDTVSAWRRATVGDMTALFAGGRQPSSGLPALGAVEQAAAAAVTGNRELIADARRDDPYPVPPNSRPRQERTPVRRRLPAAASRAVVGAARSSSP